MAGLEACHSRHRRSGSEFGFIEMRSRLGLELEPRERQERSADPEARKTELTRARNSYYVIGPIVIVNNEP